MGDLTRAARHLTRRVRIVSNLNGLGRARCPGLDVDFVPCEGRDAGPLTAAHRFWRALRADYVVINSAPRALYEFCLLRMLVPFARCRVVSLDTVLPVHPTDTLGHRIGLRLKRRLFTQVHLFIEYFRDTAGYERCYGMPRHKFRYVPFKINRYDRVIRTAVRDEGYIFCGGNTRRDFATLIEAARELPWPLRIVTMSDAVIGGHGSRLDERNLPPNVEVIRHDGSASFVDHIAGARIVALPIVRENISASGIGVYLTCMALGKCVVISSGPAVDGVVPEGAAIVVPPEDPAALRAAIERAMTDEGLRARTAAAGQAYALPLGGEARLCESVLGVIAADLGVVPPASVSEVSADV